MDDRSRLSRPADAACTETSPFKAAEPEPLLIRPFPVSAELPGYRAPSARRGLVAGVTVAALALPAAMAYTEVAGASPVSGLCALLLPAVAYVLFGSSRQLIVGPEGIGLDPRRRGGPPARGGGQPGRGGLAAMLALMVAA